MDRIVVTGLGVISALGNSTGTTRTSLMKGVSGIAPPDFVKSKYSDTLLFGEVKINSEQLAEKFRVTNPGVTRTSLLALQAFDDAIADCGLRRTDLQSNDTALVAASTVGGMCQTDELYRDANKDEGGSPFLASYDCASVTLFLQERYGIKGIVNTINTACSSSANAIMYGARLIENGFAKRAIVGGADALAKFTINGFNSLGILSPDRCRPFDETRNGLNLGEGAAFMVLEK